MSNATAIRKKVPWYRRHGHANATLARHHRHRRHANATAPGHRRHANATRLHHRRHPRRHNPDGLGAPTPGDAADGVVVAAPEGPIERAGISSGLEALAALHRKGALTDSEFAAAKAKLPSSPSSWDNINYQLTVSGEGGDAGGAAGISNRSATYEAAAAPDASARSTVPPPAHQSPHTTTSGRSEHTT